MRTNASTCRYPITAARRPLRLLALLGAVCIGLLNACHTERAQHAAGAGAATASGAGTGAAGAQSQPAEQRKWVTLRDDWYSLTLAGIHSGWMRMAREDDGARYRSVTEMTLQYNRGGLNIDTDSFVEWTEGHDGRPLHLKIARKNKDNPANAPNPPNADAKNASVWDRTRNGDPSGLLSVKYEWEFEGDTVTKIGTRDGQEIRAQIRRPGGAWLTPAATERFIASQLAADARTFEYETLDASEMLRGIKITATLVGPDDFAFGGELIPVTVWKTTNSLNAGETIVHYARSGRLMYSSLETGSGILETRLSPKDEALAGPQPTTAPNIQLAAVKPDRALTATSRAIYELRLSEGKLPRLPSAGAQTVEMAEDGRSARATVDTSKTSAATAVELMERDQREQSAIAIPETQSVLDLAAQAIRQSQGLSPLEVATSARAVVHQRFAAQGGSEAQVRGDGVEAARKLCSVLRVHQITSRIVSGLAYSSPPGGEGTFEWRAWTQALIDGRWLDLDPAGSDQFSAGHILTDLGDVGVPEADPDPVDFRNRLSKVQIRIVSQE